MTGIITAIVIVLAVLVALQIIRIFELSRKISDRPEHEVTHADNNRQGIYLLIFGVLFMISFFWMLYAWGPVTLPKPASEHGVDYDNLMAISMGIIILVFVIVQPILFWFSYRYRGIEGRTATYYEHNNKLELIWTSVPAVALAVLIIYGLTNWANVMNPNPEDEPMIVEVYGKQFAWNVRYAGEDNQLGYAHVRNVGGSNMVGVDVDDEATADDFITSEIHLPVGKPVMFKFRSQDVIHSAYFPHFRAQMNCVPGMTTQFQFTPTVTTEEMRKDPKMVAKVNSINALREARGDEPYEFDYILLCNKICGAAHYNMQVNVIVESEEDFNAWVAEQKTLSETL